MLEQYLKIFDFKLANKSVGGPLVPDEQPHQGPIVAAPIPDINHLTRLMLSLFQIHSAQMMPLGLIRRLLDEHVLSALY